VKLNEKLINELCINNLNKENNKIHNQSAENYSFLEMKQTKQFKYSMLATKKKLDQY